ncbi:MAG: hypothetical protein K8W52_31550 [Deltaproteobacteria bacterium]|nr:hypothetical protein [Deltaproteobacteria bacterium]
MSRSPFRSSTEIAVALALASALVGACSGDTCGPTSAAVDGLTLAGTGVDVTYTSLVASGNNDCPETGAPVGVVSLTIAGAQKGGSFPITFCVPRPDRLGDAPVALGSAVQIVDLTADLGGGCTLSKATTGAITGTASVTGLCSAGEDPAGFALTIDGVVPMKRTCASGTDVLMLALSGTIAVAGPP